MTEPQHRPEGRTQHRPENQPEHRPPHQPEPDEHAAAAGRSCPLHYRYPPTALAGPTPAGWADLDVLYVVGGLYGNEAALAQVLSLFAAEHGRKRLIFNGDFHWFDADPASFARVQAQVLAFDALRGNVETELSLGAAEVPDEEAADAGCGCAYPEWVDQTVVDRSNRILARLQQAASPAQRQQLAALPMWQRAEVGGLAVAIVHGDAQSLSGWGFAQEHLQSPEQRRQVAGWFNAAQVQAFACSHTCLPVFQRIGQGTPERWVHNNGAAGMPNLRGEPAGLLTRYALRAFEGPQRRAGVVQAAPGGQPVHVDLININYNSAAFERQFLACWPPGSDAHASYFQRVQAGPGYDAGQLIRPED